MDGSPAGKIITFYSYKGGTGRTMALANVAWILASAGLRVLTVDWDLEAPGLHRYFQPFLFDADLKSSEGLIDFINDFTIEALSPAVGGEEDDGGWIERQSNYLRYAVSLDWEFPGGGTLDFIPAGRQDSSYASRVNSVNWQDFYERLGGSALLEAMKKRMRREYDYVLIDSRTGVSDIAGICTIQLPDIVVFCYVLSRPSIDGTASVARAIANARPQHPPRMFPVPMRVEHAEMEKMERRWRSATEALPGLPAHLAPGERESYLREVQFPYIAYYNYEEVLAVFGDRPGQRNTLLGAAERLTSYLTDGRVRGLVGPDEKSRLRVLQRFERSF